MLMLLTGCGLEYPDLDSDAQGFRMAGFVISDDDSSLAIDYNGRTYIPYGTGGLLNKEEIDKCVGFVVQDSVASSNVDENNKDTRIYTLVLDKENNFLMEYYTKSYLMNQPIFYRAIDTKGKEIDIPKYIRSLDYDYWKEDKDE